MSKLPTTCKAFVLEALGFDGIQLRERAIPALGAGDVLVRIQSVAINYRDLKILRGAYARQPTLPVIPLSDGAGEVVAAGPDAGNWKPGDRVVVAYMKGWLTGLVRGKGLGRGGEAEGTAQEYMVVDGRELVRIPSSLTVEEAATLPCAAVTAWNGLVASGQVKAGDDVLTMGSGGVSIFALQIAKMSGARVIATSSDEAKMQRLKELGAADVINYRTTPDWERRVREITGGRGVDQVVEVGGRDTMKKSIAALRDGGHLAKIGNLAGDIEPGPEGMERGIRYSRIGVGSVEMTADLLRAMALHGVKPVIDRRFSFWDLKPALQELEKGKHFGKITLNL